MDKVLINSKSPICMIPYHAESAIRRWFAYVIVNKCQQRKLGVWRKCAVVANTDINLTVESRMP